MERWKGAVAAVTSARMLVVGGSGFIGHHVVRRAISQGWSVTSVGRCPPITSREVPGATIATLDLASPDPFAELQSNCFEYVVNLGGYIDHSSFSAGGRKVIRTHFDGLLSLVEHLDRPSLQRFVQIGSSDEYGDQPALQHENLRERPISPYSLAKASATHFLQMLHRTEMFPAVTLRLFLTYGPGQRHDRLLPQVILGCLEGRRFPVSPGEQLRDFCFVEDTVDAIFRCLSTQQSNGQVINVGSGIPRSIRSVVELVARQIGTGEPQFGGVPYRSNESVSLVADISAAKGILGWSPQISLDDGIAATINWMRHARG
jgi:nucleoside-diphosphate-sugar epimerase